MSAEAPRVFLSYSHDSEEHLNRVLDLADRLRAEGIDAYLDQYEPYPAQGWPRWIRAQIKAARFVLVVATATYERRFEGEEEEGQGLGVRWQGAILTQELFEAGARTTTFLPVVLSQQDAAHVPFVLRGFTPYDASTEDGYDKLYRRLTDQPEVEIPPLGKRRTLPPRRALRRSDALDRALARDRLAALGQAEPSAALPAGTGLEKLTWSDLRDLCKDISEHRMATVRGKYDPQLYLRREKAYQAFEKFLNSKDKKCFVLIGKSGVGKSNFILAVGGELQQRSRDDVIVLMYDGAHLKATPPLTAFISQDFSTWLRLPDGEIENIWAEIDQIEGIKERQMVLYVDAINESPEARELLKQLDELIQQPWRWLKVVISSRPETWQNVRKGLILSEKFYYREESAQHVGVELEPFSCSEHLRPFSGEELPEVYGKYQTAFRLQTEYRELQPHLRSMLRDPLNLLLVAKTYYGNPIPKSLDRFTLIGEYVDALCDSQRLNRLGVEDLDFLERALIPLMMKDGRYRNRITVGDINAAGDELKERIYSDRILDDGRRRNESFVNLVDADILTHEKAGREKIISFKYERFYDYFVGKHLFEISQLQADKGGFFGTLVSKLEGTLFLWGPLRRILIELLTSAKEYALIGELGHTDIELQAELLVSVLSEYYPRHQRALDPVLSDWLDSKERDSLAPNIAAKIAIACLIEGLLKRLLIHPREDMRTLVVQAIHELWKANAKLTTKILDVLPAQVSPWHLFRSQTTLKTLFYASVLLVFRDYYDVGAATETVEVVRKLWEPILAKLFLVSRIRWLERGMRRVSSKIIVSLFKNVERKGFAFSFQDATAFFPATAYEREMMERLLPHLDAAAGQAPEPVEALMAIIEELAKNEEDTSFLRNAAEAAAVSHFNADPRRTAKALDQLLEKMEKLYLPTVDPKHPTASVWWILVGCTFTGASYKKKMSRETAKQVFAVLARSARDETLRYCGRFRYRCGESLFCSSLDIVALGYHFDIPEAGRDLLEKIVKFHIDKNDHDALRSLGIPFIAMGMVRYRIPEAGVRALSDFIRLVLETEYLDRLDAKDQARFWQEAADSLIERASVYRKDLLDLLDRFQPGELPDAFTVRIRNASPKDNLGYHTAEAWMDALHRGLSDEDPAFRDILKWFLRTATKVESVDRLAESFISHLLDKLFPEGSLLSRHSHESGASS